MEWLLDRIGPRTTKLWPFEAAGALGTAAAAKAPRGRVVFQNKSVSWKSLEGQHRGAAKNSREYYRGGWSPSPLPMSRCDSRESRGGVACVGASPWGLPHPREAVWRPCYQGWLGCPKRGHGCPGRHHRCSGSGHG